NWANVACSDMNWERLTRWREMVAQFFDGAQLRPYLDRINQVRIEFALSKRGGPVNRAQALMLGGWLASRLGWIPMDPVYEMLRSDGTRPSATRLNLQAAGRQITILVQPGEETSDVAGEICAVRLEVVGPQPDGKPEAS